MRTFKYVVGDIFCTTTCPIKTDGTMVGSLMCQECPNNVAYDKVDKTVICSALTADGYYPCPWCGEPTKGENTLCPACHKQAMNEKLREEAADYLSEQKDDESERYERGDGCGNY